MKAKDLIIWLQKNAHPEQEVCLRNGLGSAFMPIDKADLEVAFCTEGIPGFYSDQLWTQLVADQVKQIPGWYNKSVVVLDDPSASTL